MLVLSRKVNEEIIIDGRIRVQVLQVKGKTIRIGISAPDDVKILRGELQPFAIEESPASGIAAVREVCPPYLIAQAS
jgi:carbon storage regulator CsrA